MKNQLSDLTNSGDMDESFSNAGGCGTPPVCSPTKVQTGTRKDCKTVSVPCPTFSKPFKKCNKEVCVNVPTVKTVPNTECVNRMNTYKNCVIEKAKSIPTNAISEIKKIDKKIKKSLKTLVGKARFAYKKLLRRQILSAVFLSIRSNAHGIATRLYPAITSDVALKQEKFKASFKPKANKSYTEVLREWTSLGGKKSKLDDAIRKGARLKIHKNKKKSGFDGEISKDFSIVLGGYDFTPTFSNFTTNSVDENRAIYDYFSGINGYSRIDGDGDGMDDETGMPIETSESTGVSDEVMTTEDTTALAEEGVDTTDTEEKQSGWKNFIAKIMSIFKRNKADESPYEEGTAEDTTFETDLAVDESTQPKLDSEGNEITDELDTTKTDPLEDPTAKVSDIKTKVMGVDSDIIYGVSGLLLGAVGGFLIGMATKSTLGKKLMFAGIGGVTLGVSGYFVPTLIKKAKSEKSEEGAEELGK